MSARNPKRRILSMSPEMLRDLETRKNTLGIPVSVQIRQALERYIERAPQARDRLLTTNREATTGVYISDALWDELRRRKRDKETLLDLNEQVQVAIALYLESAAQTVTIENKPIVAQTEPTASRLDLQELQFALQQLGIEVKKPIADGSQKVKVVPKLMEVPCGTSEDLENLIMTFGDDYDTETLTGTLADLATEHSFVARASGWSMANGGLPDDIQPNDLLLMTPLAEFPGEICAGTIVFAKVRYKSQRIVWTLKTYTGKCLKSNNPKFKNIDFGDDIESVQVIAVCRAKLPVVWK